LLDALVVAPVGVPVDKSGCLVAGMLLLMFGIDGFHLHTPEEALRGRVVRKAVCDQIKVFSGGGAVLLDSSLIPSPPIMP